MIITAAAILAYYHQRYRRIHVMARLFVLLHHTTNIIASAPQRSANLPHSGSYKIMPKVSRVGKFRAAAKGPTQPSNNPSKAVTNDTSIEGNEPLSRGQRKRLAKREQYLKREKMVLSSLRMHRLEEQKGKLDGFDAIRESLPGFTSAPPPDTKSKTEVNPVLTCNTNKSKKSIANTEIRHMGLVLEHPVSDVFIFVVLMDIM